MHFILAKYCDHVIFSVGNIEITLSNVGFRLTNLAPKVVVDYGNRFCSTVLPILYLTNFYTTLPHQQLINQGIRQLPKFEGAPTKMLMSAINRTKAENGWSKVLFCCEPVMGDNPKSITYKTTALSKFRKLGHWEHCMITCGMMEGLCNMQNFKS